MENYFAAGVVQILLSLVACVLLAMVAARLSPRPLRMHAAQATLWLAALCTFTAVYDAEPLTGVTFAVLHRAGVVGGCPFSGSSGALGTGPGVYPCRNVCSIAAAGWCAVGRRAGLAYGCEGDAFDRTAEANGVGVRVDRPDSLHSVDHPQRPGLSCFSAACAAICH